MAQFYKVSMIMQVATGEPDANAAAVRLGGWSEGFYDESQPVAQIRAQTARLCTFRAALLPATGVIVAQRYQLVNPIGPSFVDLQRFPGSAGQCDYPSLSLLCKASAGGNNPASRSIYIRGIPDLQITRGEFTPTADYRGKMEAYATALVGPWNFRAQDRTGQLTDVAAIDATGIVYVPNGLAGVAANSRVRVLRTKQDVGDRLVGGSFYVDSVLDATSFKVKRWTHGATTGGGVRLLTYDFPQIAAVTLGRIVTKKVGRPFESFRGRVSKRR